MENDKILVTRVVEGKEFYNNDVKYGVVNALEECQKQKYEVQFIPAIIDTRINSPKEARIWKTWWESLSLKATGKTKQGKAVVVYAHIPNYFSETKNIRKELEKGLKNGAGVMPQTEFQRLVDLDELTDVNGNRLVWVKDYSELKDSKSGVISLDEALGHPQTIPFCGGEARAERYLEKHKQVYGEKIGVWHLDDLAEEPLGRLLFVGNDYYDGLLGHLNLNYYGRFVGVKKSGEATLQKILPSKLQIEEVVSGFVAPCNQEELAERLSRLYK